jgi:DNA-binding XRE family transcriptional regulator
MTIERNKKRLASEDLAHDFGALSFADLLISYREGEELTQAQVAKRIGISKQRLCDFEKGRRLPSLRAAFNFGKQLGKHPETWVLVVIEDMLRKEKLNIKLAVA